VFFFFFGTPQSVLPLLLASFPKASRGGRTDYSIPNFIFSFIHPALSSQTTYSSILCAPSSNRTRWFLRVNVATLYSSRYFSAASCSVCHGIPSIEWNVLTGCSSYSSPLVFPFNIQLSLVISTLTIQHGQPNLRNSGSNLLLQLREL